MLIFGLFGPYFEKTGEEEEQFASTRPVGFAAGKKIRLVIRHGFYLWPLGFSRVPRTWGYAQNLQGINLNFGSQCGNILPVSLTGYQYA